jgi:hypothetical protein
LQSISQTRAEVQRDVSACIDGFCNRTRLHSSTGYVAPIEMELKAAQTRPPFRGKFRPRIDEEAD